VQAYELQQEFLFQELEQLKADKKDLAARLDAVEKAHTKVGGPRPGQRPARCRRPPPADQPAARGRRRCRSMCRLCR
jgi:hypothetical protein